jgi:hypothetical protein
MVLVLSGSIDLAKPRARVKWLGASSLQRELVRTMANSRLEHTSSFLDDYANLFFRSRGEW